MNFNVVFEKYKIFASKRRKEQGFVTFTSDFNSNILPYFKDRNIEDIKSLDIIDWQNAIYDKKYKNSYNDKLYIEFRAFMNYCCLYYDLDKNPFDKVPKFVKKPEEKHHDFYNLEEYKKFINCVDDNIYKQFFNFMFFVGTRPGETYALRFSDIEGDIVHIRNNMTSKGGRHLTTPKNKSSIRTIMIDNQLKKDLLELKKFYIDTYKMSDYDYFVFGGIKCLSSSTVCRRRNEACKKANLRRITLHQFRHSHATLLLQNDVMINEVSRRLGHSNVTTTLNIYTHTDLIQEKKSIDTLNFLRSN